MVGLICRNKIFIDLLYKNEILSGKKPTAVSLSVLDIKEPSTYPDEDTFPEITQHWCIANYLIDGHHKIKAAAELNAEITLLAFFATDKGVSTEDEIKELLSTNLFKKGIAERTFSF